MNWLLLGGGYGHGSAARAGEQKVTTKTLAAQRAVKLFQIATDHGFYGRINAYEEGLAGTDGLLAEALDRNVFSGAAADGAAQALAVYLKDSVACLGEIPLEAMMGGRLAFAPPSAAAGEPDL